MQRDALELIQEEEAVALTKDLIRYSSLPGKVAEIGDFILDWFRQNGVETVRQEIGEGRLNAIGIVRGTGRGLSLSLNGHMDHMYSGQQDDLLYLSKEFFERPMHGLQAYVEGGKIYGCGVGNMKAGLAAMMLAVKAVKQSGIELKGDLIGAAVQEVHSFKEQSGRLQGDIRGLEYQGPGGATSYMLQHGIHSDYAICVDNSNLKITWVQPGYCSLLITVAALPGSAPYYTPSADRRSSQNAILKMIPIIDAIEKWGADYARRNTYECKGGTCMPPVHITSIEAGSPHRDYLRPGSCTIGLMMMIAPGTKPLEVVKEVESLLEREGITAAEVKMYTARLGYEAKGVSGLVEVVGGNYRKLFGSELEIADPPYCSVWTDLNCYAEVGIPCVKIGVGLSAADRLKVGIDAYDSHPVEDIVKKAKLDAMVALDVCTRTTPLRETE